MKRISSFLSALWIATLQVHAQDAILGGGIIGGSKPVAAGTTFLTAIYTLPSPTAGITTTNGASSYISMNSIVGSNENNSSIMASHGRLSNFQVNGPTQSAGNFYTFTFRHGTKSSATAYSYASTPVTCTYGNGDGLTSCFSTATEDYKPGDRIDIQATATVPVSGLNNANTSYSFTITDLDGQHATIFNIATNFTGSTGSVTYASPGMSQTAPGTTTEINASVLAPTPGTLDNPTISAVTPTTSQTWNAKIYVDTTTTNNCDTSSAVGTPTVTTAAGTNGDGTNPWVIGTGSAHIIAGNCFSFGYIGSQPTMTTSSLITAIRWTPDNNYEMPYFSILNAALSSPRYVNINGNNAQSSLETTAGISSYLPPLGGLGLSVLDMTALQNTTVGGTAGRTWTLRQNQSTDINPSITIATGSAYATGGTPNSITPSPTLPINLKVSITGSGQNTVAWSKQSLVFNVH